MKLKLIGLMLFCGLSLQAQVIKGLVKDNGNGAPIAFLNVGIVGTTIGTLSERSGRFELTIPEKFKDSKITIYGLGYDRKDIPVSAFGTTELEITMNPLSTQLDDYVVNKKPSVTYAEKEYLTVKRKALQRSYRSLSPKNPEHSGTVIASKVSIPEPHFIISASVFVAETRLDTLKFRLRLYEIDTETGLPGKDIVQKTILRSSTVRKGWVEIDLEDEYIFLDRGDYFLGFELIEEKAERYRVHNARKEWRSKVATLAEKGVKGVKPVEREVDGKMITDYMISLSPKKMEKHGLDLDIFTTKFEVAKGKEAGIFRSSSFEDWRKSQLGIFRMKLKYEYEQR